MAYADLIKKYRLEQKLSQKELSEGICTQSVVSKIEKGELSPSVELFFNLVRKLQVPASEIMQQFDMPIDKSKIENLQLYDNMDLREMVAKRDYYALSLFLQSFKSEKLTTSLDFYFYKFIEKMVEYNEERDFKIMVKLLDIIKEKEVYRFPTLYTEILLYISEVSEVAKEFDFANEVYNEALVYIDRDVDYRVKIDFYEKYAQFLQKQEKSADEVLLNLNIALDTALKNKTLYNIGRLYLQKTKIYNERKLYSMALENCEKAIFAFTLENNNIQREAAIGLRETIYQMQRETNSYMKY